jgi:hypothetical protein
MPLLMAIAAQRDQMFLTRLRPALRINQMMRLKFGKVFASADCAAITPFSLALRGEPSPIRRSQEHFVALFAFAFRNQLTMQSSLFNIAPSKRCSRSILKRTRYV